MVPSNKLTININDDKMVNGYTILFLYEVMLPYRNYTYNSKTSQTISKPITLSERSFNVETTINRVIIRVPIGFTIFIELLDCCEFGWLWICDGPDTFMCVQIDSIDMRHYFSEYFAVLIDINLEAYHIPVISFHYKTMRVANTNVKISLGGSFSVLSHDDGLMHQAFTLAVKVPMKIVFDIWKFHGMTGNNCIYGGKFWKK